MMSVVFNETVYDTMVVVGSVSNNLLGEDFITKYRCNWDHDEGCFIINGSRVPLKGKDGSARSGRIIALETVRVPAGHEAVIKSGLSSQRSSWAQANQVGILTPEKRFMEKCHLAIARTLVDLTGSVVYTRVFNPGFEDVTVYKHTHMALFTPVVEISDSVSKVKR